MRVQDVSILVVDDVNAIRVQIKELLKRVGFEQIEIAAHGTEAIKLLTERPFQLVLADWHMAPVDGMELLRYVRGHDTLKNLGFIMVTAEGAREMVIQAVQGGVDEYLVKPLTITQIQQRVFKVLVGKKVLL